MQIIKDNVQPVGSIFFELPLAIRLRYTAQFSQLLHESIRRRFSSNYTMTEISSWTMINLVVHELDHELYGSQDRLSDITAEIVGLIQRAADESKEPTYVSKENITTTFIARRLPTCQVITSQAKVICDTQHLTSLKGIEVPFASCEKVTIEKASNVKSHVLGLLCLPKASLTNYNKNSGGTAHDGWINIMNKHLLVGNKDVLACQEELIDAGYEELAQI